LAVFFFVFFSGEIRTFMLWKEPPQWSGAPGDHVPWTSCRPLQNPVDQMQFKQCLRTKTTSTYTTLSERVLIYRKSMRNITPQEMCRLWFSHEQLEKVYVHLKHMNKTLTRNNYV